MDEEHIKTNLLTLTIKECFIYKIPPLRTASGHRAEDWNLLNPIFTGCLKVYQADSLLRIVIYSLLDPTVRGVTSDDHLQQFCECVIEIKPGESILQFVDSVIDSSRYFVLQVKDPHSNRKTLVGIGFREREAAFDLKSCLNEFIRYIDRMSLAAKMAAASLLEDNSRPENPSANDKVQQPSTADHGGNSAHTVVLQHIKPLQEGEKMQLKLRPLKNNSKHQNTTSNPPTSTSSNQSVRSLLLPKPPDINSRSVHHIATSPVTAKDHEIQTITTDNEKASNILFDGEKQDIDDDEVEFGGWESGNS